MRTMYFAGGCFWGIEEYFSGAYGVISTEVGYANGNSKNPTYEEVCYENTGFVETVKIDYDEKKVSLSSLLEKYIENLDSTLLTRKPFGEGDQYRTGLYYTDEKDLKTILIFRDKQARLLAKPIYIEILPLDVYYKAEEYHQKYLKKSQKEYFNVN